MVQNVMAQPATMMTTQTCLLANNISGGFSMSMLPFR
jgi:hypothetical protein